MPHVIWAWIYQQAFFQVKLDYGRPKGLDGLEWWLVWEKDRIRVFTRLLKLEICFGAQSLGPHIMSVREFTDNPPSRFEYNFKLIFIGIPLRIENYSNNFCWICAQLNNVHLFILCILNCSESLRSSFHWMRVYFSSTWKTFNDNSAPSFIWSCFKHI